MKDVPDEDDDERADAEQEGREHFLENATV